MTATKMKFTFNEEITRAAVKAMIEHGIYGFNLMNEMGSYIDFEKEMNVSDLEGSNDYRSLNVRITLDLDDQIIYVLLGDNRGDGFNPLMEIDGKSTKKGIQGGYTLLFDKMPESGQALCQKWQGVVSELLVLTEKAIKLFHEKAKLIALQY